MARTALIQVAPARESGRGSLPGRDWWAGCGLGAHYTRWCCSDDGAIVTAAADPASTRSGAVAQSAPSTSQSTSSPGCGSRIAAAPIGIDREATIAPATPTVVFAAAARKGAAEASSQ